MMMMQPPSPTRRLSMACGLLLLAYCSLCGAFLPPPVVTTLRHRGSSLAWARDRRGRGATSSAVRMQQSDEELQVAVRTLAAQVEDLTAIVRRLAEETGPGAGGAEVAPSATSHNINGSAAGNGAGVPGVTAAGVKELVSTSAAQQRIERWLSESGGGQTVTASPQAPAVSPVAVASPAVAEVVATPVAPEVEAPPAEAVPAAAAPAGTGYKVKIEWDGAIHEVMCDAETTVLEAAMDAGLELPHSCMSGSCLTCPGKLVSGSVDQSEGVLEDEQTEAGYLLTCISYPQSDLHFAVIEEDELP